MFRLAGLSLANRALIALITVFVAAFGVISMGSLKQELIPSLEFPQITVLSAMPDASPQVVDKQVSQPLESALKGVENLDSSTATSRTGVSTVNLSFTYGTNLDRARSQVDRAIANARPDLPDDVNPQPLAGSLSDFPIVFIAVSSDQPLSGLNSELTRLSVPRLQKISGVRSAEVTGGARRHIAIQPDTAALAADGLSVTDLVDALKNNGSLVPAGSLTEGDKSLSVQIGSPVDSLKAIRSLPLPAKAAATAPSGSPDAPGTPASPLAAAAPVTIGAVATVKIADDPATSITRTNGVETLALSVTKAPDGDTVGISHAVQDMLPALQAEIGHGATFTTVFDQAPFIEKSIHDLTVEGLLGLGFAVVVILVFLLSVRSTLVTAISIPLSLLITFICLYAFGYSLNILTLGALTIAIGRVVDDSIVVIENIKRHLGYGEAKQTAILTAIREVAGAITASTLTTVAVFLPVAFVGDLAGELFRPFALTVTIALLASLGVALTIVPVLAYWFLKSPAAPAQPAGAAGARAGTPGAGAAGDDEGARAGLATGRTGAAASGQQQREVPSRLQRGYLPILHGTQRHPVITVIAGAVILGGTLAMTPLMETNLFGDTGQNSFSVTQTLPAGSSLQATSDAARRVESALAKTAGVDNVQVTIGNATTGFAAFASGGTNVASFTVITDQGADQSALRDQARRSLEQLKHDGTINVTSQGGGLGLSSNVDINISAANHADLNAASNAIIAAVKDLPDAGEVTSNLSSAQPVVQVRVDRKKAVAAGLNEKQVAGVLASTISPLPAGTVRIDTNDYPVQIGKGARFTSIGQLRRVRIPTPDGPVPLSAVASVAQEEIPTTITSSGGERTATVSVAPAGGNLGELSSQVQSRIDALALPAGASAQLGGAATQQAQSFSQLGLALLAAIAIVYVIMVAAFKSLVQPLILLVSVPFAATGAIALLLITRIPLGLPSLIGLLMLVGIVVTNAIVLIDLINQYRRAGPGREPMPVAEAITHGARQRLRPILMTALATIFALTPMGLGLTGKGGFISQPLAVVVIGGLVSSTALTLILVPVLYRLVEERRENRRLARGALLGHLGAGIPDGRADGNVPHGRHARPN